MIGRYTGGEGASTRAASRLVSAVSSVPLQSGAIWHNWLTGTPVKRSLIAGDHI